MILSAIRSFFLLINIFFAAFFLISCLAPLADPEKFWFVSIFGLGFLPLFFANAFWIFFWLLFKIRFMLVSIIALATGAWNISNHFSFYPGCFAPEQEPSFTVMSFNVKVFDLYSWSENNESQNALIDVIKFMDPDILCIQEFYTDDTQRESSMKRLRELYPHVHFHNTLTLQRDHHWGIATFSKFPIVKRDSIIFKNAQLNVGISTDILLDGDTTRIFNAHLQSIHFDEEEFSRFEKLRRYEKTDIPFYQVFEKLKSAFIKRAVQAQQLKQLIKESPYKKIVCTDMNDTPNSYAYRVVANGLKDTFKKAGCVMGRTYRGPFPFVRIDYIFVEDDFEVLKSTTVNNLHSDHNGVWAAVR